MNPATIGSLTAVIQAVLALVSVVAIVLSTRLALSQDRGREGERLIRAFDKVIEHDTEITKLFSGINENQKILTQHLIECAEQHTRHVTKLESVSDQLGIIQRTIDGLQSQIRVVAIEGKGAFFKRGDL